MDKLYANEFYSKQYKWYLGVCVVPHALGTLICNGLAFIASIAAVTIAGSIISHSELWLGSNQELGMYRSYPKAYK